MFIGNTSGKKSIVLGTCALLASGLITASPAVAASSLCNGVKATISSSARTINGTSGNDVILVLGNGNHVVNARAGDDLICSGGSSDSINSGAGNDVINSGAGNDTVDAGTGNDVINTGSGNDVVKAGTGNDTVDAGSGNDSVMGALGDDSINGGAGNDQLNGENGSDIIWGKAGNDSLTGGAGNDSLQGGAGKDVLTPGTGSNTCAIDVPDQVVGICSGDDDSPQVSNILAMSSVTAGTTATFMWSASDATGVGYTDFRFGGPSGWVTNWCGFVSVGTLISGNAKQGTYSVTCEIPETAVNTTYTVFINASDFFGNNTYGISADFTVVGGIADDAEPTVNSVEASSNILGRGEEFTVTYRASDESGVAFIYGYFYGDGNGIAGSQGLWITPGLLSEPVSGNDKDGVWRQSFVVNDFAPMGTYTLYVGRADRYGNRNFTQADVRITVSAR
jgi:RTX calcium-binding nonapeptide repeat (4 copies)